MKCLPTSRMCENLRRNDQRIRSFLVIQIICLQLCRDAWCFVPSFKRQTKSNVKLFPKTNAAMLLWSPTQAFNKYDVTADSQITTTYITGTRSARSALYGMWSQNDEIEGSDRIKACIPYLLPLIDGDHFGKYMYERIPLMGSIDQLTIGPLADLGHSIPFLSLGLFIALTLGTRFNTSMSRNLRFSAQQAALIDVALLIPELIGSSFVEDPLPRYIAEPCCNFVWYAYMSIVIYCLISNLRGKKPDQIPYLSSSADLMVGPF
jgi:hypothetical protein